MKFYTSDIHLFHRRICDYTNRNLVTTQANHEDWIIDLWNNQVKPGDIVYHLGDLSFAKYAHHTAEILKQMNGQIFCIKGNHDRKAHLVELKENGIIAWWGDYREEKLADKQACLFHFPISCWHRQHYGSLHLHGHSHGGYQGQGKTLDVGLDSAYNILGEHRLFTEDDILNFMEPRPIWVRDYHQQRAGEL